MINPAVKGACLSSFSKPPALRPSLAHLEAYVLCVPGVDKQVEGRGPAWTKVPLFF